MNLKSATKLIVVLVLSAGVGWTSTSPDHANAQDAGEQQLLPFPAGYIDSPYVLPDESAVYFIQSPASTIDFITGNPDAKPVTPPLPGHQASDTGFWWNTDIYVSYRNSDGTWGQPQNVGAPVNSENLEGGPWVSDDQTTMIFMRESVGDVSDSGAFVSHRASKDDAWGAPERLPGELGDYGHRGFTDLMLTPGGNLYFWSELVEGDGTLYWAQSIGDGVWAPAEPLPASFQTEANETQPWVNDEETKLCFNRRGSDGNTQLLCATRADMSVEWGIPAVIEVDGIADGNGATVWGEPSFTRSNRMYFVRFDTADPNWNAILSYSDPREDGSYGAPQPLTFE